MNIDAFDYDLPQQLIAQSPLSDRKLSRLLTLDRRSGTTTHRQFMDLIDLLQPEDTLVLNDTKVIPARLFGVKQDTGARVELLLLKQEADDCWEVLAKPAKRLKTGSIVEFGAVSAAAMDAETRSTRGSEPLLLAAEVLEERDMGIRRVKFTYNGVFHALLDRLGEMPLPPYIKRQLDHKERYQTVYARHEGSAAAPTAGLHFTPEVLKQIEEKGVTLAYLTLHVGLGTFRPVSVEHIEEHRMHSEYFNLDQYNAELINKTVQRNGRLVAVGTTSARTLETIASDSKPGEWQARSGWTDIFIYPGYTFQAVDALLTNFHLPKSTLLMMISAFAGRERVLAAYREAVAEQYRFFSFGDAMFIS